MISILHSYFQDWLKKDTYMYNVECIYSVEVVYMLNCLLERESSRLNKCLN